MAKKTAHFASLVRPSLLQLQTLSQKQGSPFSEFRSVMQKDLFDALDSFDDERQTAVKKGAFLTKGMSTLLPWEKTEEQKGMEANPNDLEGNAAGAKSYNSRSGQILGILKQMLEEMSKNLALAQKTELEAIIGFQRLKAAKGAEIAAGTKMVKTLE